MSAATIDLGGLDEIDLNADSGVAASGLPLHVPFMEVYEDPGQPRTKFDPIELQEMADDIAQMGILQAIVVWPKDDRGYKIRFGAKRRRAAEIASKSTGVMTVPIQINDSNELDDYAQVSENQKRSGLTALDMAQFIERKTKAGHSKSFIAKKLGMAAGRISEYLAILDMPASLKAVYEEGRCVSPQVLYLLVALHKRHPEAVNSWLLEGAGEITRTSIAEFERFLLNSTPSVARLPTEEGAGAALTEPDAQGAASQMLPGLPTEEGARKRALASKSSKGKRPDPNIASLERRLTENLGARSKVHFNPKTGNGSVAIRFTSLEELDGLLERFQVPAE